MKSDHVDRVLDRSGKARSDANTVEYTARLARVAVFSEKLITAAYAKLGLKHGEVDVLDALTLGNAPQSPTSVGSSLLCSSGAMTNRLDRLEKAGLLSREYGTAADRRAVLLSITPEGRKAARQARALRDALGSQLLPGLTQAERETLVGLLRKMLISFEEDGTDLD